MANAAAETLNELLYSLPPYPDMLLLLFSAKWGILEETLLHYAEENGHTILLYTLSETLSARLPRSEHLKRRPYRIGQPRYNLQGRLYNHAFVFGTIPDTPEAFAKKVYTGIANAGGLYLLLERNDPGKAARWEETLQASNYVASSTIELDEKRLLLYARKMHGWGG